MFKNFYQYILEKEMTENELENQRVPTHEVINKLEDLFAKGDKVYYDEPGERCVVITGANPGMIIDLDDSDAKKLLKSLSDTEKSSWKFGLSESENVKLEKPLREYILTHMNDARFQLKSDDFFREFSVTPYKQETLDKLRKLHDDLQNAVKDSNVEQMFTAVSSAELIPYTFGNIFPVKFSLKIIPDLIVGLEPDQKRSLDASEREFLANSFSSLNKEIKDSIIYILRERGEVLLAVIEALFYYIRIIDKDNYYRGMNSEEIIEEYEAVLEKAAENGSFSYEGPFSSIVTKSSVSADTEIAMWLCTKDMKEFVIKATISPKILRSEENVGGTTGLKFSIMLPDTRVPEKDFNFFNINELSARIKLFNDKILKKL